MRPYLLIFLICLFPSTLCQLDESYLDHGDSWYLIEPLCGSGRSQSPIDFNTTSLAVNKINPSKTLAMNLMGPVMTYTNYKYV